MPHRPFSSARSASPRDSAAASSAIPSETVPLDDSAIGTAEAAGLFELCGPFEPRPQVAAAVSGGPDSLALAWLLQSWLTARGGRLLALIVDHRLRAESAEESAAVAARLAALGIDSRLLVWGDGLGVSTGLQAAARKARYRLLGEACRAAGILHLALGHHRDDQVETLLQRADSGSGPDGLAGMPAISEVGDLRLLRPFLTLPKSRLVATCRAAGLAFVEDPSNRDERFVRGRLRARAAHLTAAGLDPRLLADLAATAGRRRAAMEENVAALLVDAVSPHPAGFATIAPALVEAPDPLALRALAQVLASIGGGRWPPRAARTQRALSRLREQPLRPATLGGCRLLPRVLGKTGDEDASGGWLAVREPTAQVCPLAPGQSLRWDGRFWVSLGIDAPPDLAVGPLGESGWRAVLKARPDLKTVALPTLALPAAARLCLPALFERDVPLAVPQLAFVRPGWDPDLFSSRFRPDRALTRGRFCVPQSVAETGSETSFTVA